MTKIGGTHFLDTIELLPDEVVVWEGGASKNGIAIQLIHFLGSVLAIVLMLSIVFGLPEIIMMDNPQYVEKQNTNVNNDESSKDAAVTKKDIRATDRRLPRKVLNTERLVSLAMFGIPLLVLLSFVLSWLRVKNYWYVVTNERICIQSGILSRQTVAVDIDKISSVISTHTILDRLFNLHSVEIVHNGLSSLRPNNGLVIFNPYKMYFVPVKQGLTSQLLHSWLPRDNHVKISG